MTWLRLYEAELVLNRRCYFICISFVLQLMVKGAVFARMSPDQKAEVVIDLQKLGYVAVHVLSGDNNLP